MIYIYGLTMLNFCELFTVVRTDLQSDNYDRQNLSYAPRDYMSAVRLANHYQQTWDPSRERWDYRVTAAG